MHKTCLLRIDNNVHFILEFALLFMFFNKNFTTNKIKGVKILRLFCVFNDFFLKIILVWCLFIKYDPTFFNIWQI